MQKYKKGFTLVEIIVCIGLITVIGISSFVGLSIIKNKNDIKSLNSMKEMIYSAAEVYLEKNEAAKEQLYSKKNGAVIPLTTLEKEGLIDFENINIENKYIVAALGTTKYLAPEGSEESCLGIDMVNSWDEGDKIIYLCGVDIEALEEKINKLEEEIEKIKEKLDESPETPIPEFNYGELPKVYFGGSVSNYVSFNDKTYRVLHINNDKVITIYNYEKFTGFNENQIELVGTNRTTTNSSTFDIQYCHDNRIINSPPFIESGTNKSKNTNGTLLDANDIANTVKCITSGEWPVQYISRGGYPSTYFDQNISFSSWLVTIPVDGSSSSSEKKYETNSFCVGGNQFWSSGAGGGEYKKWSYIQCGKASDSSKGYKLKLKPCMKIISGSGTSSYPYILKDTCS